MVYIPNYVITSYLGNFYSHLFTIDYLSQFNTILVDLQNLSVDHSRRVAR